MLNSLRKVIIASLRRLSATCEVVHSASTRKNLTYTEQIVDYLQTSDVFMRHYPHIKPNLLRIRSSTPSGVYCMSEINAETMFTSMRHHINRDIPIIETNPGLGLITRRLLTLNPKLILAYETDAYFKSVIESIASENSDVLKIRASPFMQLWKEGFKDKLYGGNRLDNFLPGIERKGWDSDPIAQIIGVVPNSPLIRYLIYSVTFQSGIIQFGRPEVYLILPPEIYWHINCEAISMPKRYSKYILFNILFNYETLCELDPKGFVPWLKFSQRKTSFLKKYGVNRENFYLVKVVPKRDLLNVLSPELLVPLWFFVYQGAAWTQNKVIPFLEKWIPGCGPVFISRGLNVFTEFRDLKHTEVLDVFFAFVNLPEFEDCPFHAALESFLNVVDDEALGDAIDTESTSESAKCSQNETI